MVKELYCVSGEIALVDDEDYEILKVRSYTYASRRGVVRASGGESTGSLSITLKNDVWRRITVADAPRLYNIDGDPLNCTRCNITDAFPQIILTKTQTAAKDARRDRNINKFTGVFRPDRKNWKARRGIVWIGSYLTEIEAARAYDFYMIDNKIEPCLTNFPLTDYISGMVPRPACVSNSQQKRRRMLAGFKGVFLSHHKTKPWRSKIQILGSGKSRSLGYFKTAEDAARAYDAAASAQFGADCYLNFPEDYGLPPRQRDAS